MEIKQKVNDDVVLFSEINERKYELHCSKDTPLGELHDVLLAMKGNIVDRLLAAQKEEKAVSDFVSNKTDIPPENAIENSDNEEIVAEEIADS